MGIGIGIVLLLIGLVLVLDVVNIDTPYIDAYGLGWIFIIVGILAIILALVLNYQHSRRTTVVDDRRPPPPPREY